MQIVLLSYCMSHGNIHRIINGYDNCGNICGQLNVFDEVNGTACHGTDQRKQKYLRVQTSLVDTIETENIQINRICVESCGNYPGLSVFTSLKHSFSMLAKKMMILECENFIPAKLF